MTRATLLLADDHAVIIEGLRHILEAHFDVVGTAVDGMTLVTSAKELRPDIVIVDVCMPRLNGIDAARRIRAANPDTKIVFLSMHTDAVYVSEALAAGGSAYVLKSSAGFEILAAVREVLEGGTFVTPAIDHRVVQSGAGSAEKAGGSLSPRRLQVVRMIAEGRRTKEIAEALHISPRTVEFHRYHAMESLGLHTIAEIVQYAIRNGLIQFLNRPSDANHST